MSEQKYCPLLRTGPTCNKYCAWYDKESEKCVVQSIESALWAISADMMDISDVMQARYTITPAGEEYLRGACRDDNQR